MLRLYRVVRVVKLVPFFKPIVLLLRGLLVSRWSFVFTIGFILYWNFAMSLFLALLMDEFAEDMIEYSNDWEFDPPLTIYTQQIWYLMITLYQTTTWDSWTNMVRTLCNSSQSENKQFPSNLQTTMITAFFVFQIVGTTLTIDNLITARILENTMGMQHENLTEKQHAMDIEKHKTLKQMAEIFRKMDVDRSGELDETEIKQAIKEKQVQAILQQTKLYERELIEILKVVNDDPNGGISQVEFLAGILPFFEQEIRVQDLTMISLRLDQLAGFAVACYRDLLTGRMGEESSLSNGFCNTMMRSLPQFFKGDQVSALEGNGVQAIMPVPPDISPYAPKLGQEMDEMIESATLMAGDVRKISDDLFHDSALHRLNSLSRQLKNVVRHKKKRMAELGIQEAKAAAEDGAAFRPMRKNS